MIKQHEESEFEQKKSQNEINVHIVEQKIKAVNRELFTMSSDSKDREKLSYLKGKLETEKKKHKKM
jgi:DNA repair protein RAD50